MNTQDLEALRKSYEHSALDERASEADPRRQFEVWLQEAIAANVPEPNAMTLATVGADGRPSTRVVLIKGLDAQGIVWYTHYDSRKGRELAGNAHAALQFHWVELERVVRIEGVVTKTDAATSEAYFQSRPLASRISALVSPQSQVVASRDVLIQATEKANAAHGDHPPRPSHWGGYRLQPDRWEFWQGRRNRLHDRLRYRLDGPEVWVRERLAP
jgi:pyridoxamine 5'-phosphate oxidase